MISISLILLRLHEVESGMWNVHIVEHLYSAIEKEEFIIHVLCLKLETIKWNKPEYMKDKCFIISIKCST